MPFQETQEKQVQPLGWGDPLEEKMTTHSRAWQATVHRIANSQTRLSTTTFYLQSFILNAFQKRSIIQIHFVTISSAQSCPTLCNPMNHSTPSLSVMTINNKWGYWTRLSLRKLLILKSYKLLYLVIKSNMKMLVHFQICSLHKENFKRQGSQQMKACC